MDYFNPAWLRNRLESGTSKPVAPEDVQATLAELTAASIASALPGAGAGAGRVTAFGICGGGARNDDLLARLMRRLPGCVVRSTADWGIPPEMVEAAAFAWFARERLDGRPTNAPDVTGARALLSMGGVYLPPAGP